MNNQMNNSRQIIKGIVDEFDKVFNDNSLDLTETQYSETAKLVDFLNTITLSDVVWKKTKILNKQKKENGSRLRICFNISSNKIRQLPTNLYNLLYLYHIIHEGKTSFRDVNFIVDISLIHNEDSEDSLEYVTNLPKIYFLEVPMGYYLRDEDNEFTFAFGELSETILNYMFQNKHSNAEKIKDYPIKQSLWIDKFIDVLTTVEKMFWIKKINENNNISSLFYDKSKRENVYCSNDMNFCVLESGNFPYKSNIVFSNRPDKDFMKHSIWSKDVSCLYIEDHVLPKLDQVEMEGRVYENCNQINAIFRFNKKIGNYDFQEWFRLPYMLACVQDFLTNDKHHYSSVKLVSGDKEY